MDINQLYIEWSGQSPREAVRLPGAGSNREYFRFTASDGTTTIGCHGTSQEENKAFIALASHLSKQGLPVPRVLAVSDDLSCYLQEDLGTVSLFDALSHGRNAGSAGASPATNDANYDSHEQELLHEAMRLLPHVQLLGASDLDFSVCYPQPQLDATGIMFDLNYFKYCFLKPSRTEFNELRLENDFHRLTSDLLADEGQWALMYRDFQARNIMLDQRPQANSSLALIDFQGARRGPIYYDVASFLWQASARYPDTLRQQLINTYYEELKTLCMPEDGRDAPWRVTQQTINLREDGRDAPWRDTQQAPTFTLPSREVFDNRLRLFVLFRLLQVLGAYGFRGYFERKKHFIVSIPPALDSLAKVVAQGTADHYPTLKSALLSLTAAPRQEATVAASPLTVTIFSFSYKKGLPTDDSGNGGGYIFDCRGTNNPGRYEQYRSLTGLDQPVIKFLEDDGEILRFLDNVYALADKHVARYIERGFTSLMFSFGCTGGQHRSVYCAQHLAEHLHQRFPNIAIRLTHREQGIRQSL